MSRNITIDPITRISGFLEINTEVNNNIIIDAKSSGLLFRGFEKMLSGRMPLDAIYFTERICGICSSAHAVASAMAIDSALKLNIDSNDIYLRDLIHGFDIIQNHLRHFYFFVVPDYVRLPYTSPLFSKEYKDYRLPENLNEKICKDYFKSVNYSKMAHEGLAILGAKAPHNHGIFAGGVTANIDSYKLIKVKSIINSIKEFCNDCLIEDINIIACYYPDYYNKGNSYSNYMSYGLFNVYEDNEMNYVNPGIIMNGISYSFVPNKISEDILYSWYVSDIDEEKPGSDYTESIEIKKTDAYSFIKAPRYDGFAMEVGPLARMMLTGIYTKGNSCMDRNMARVLETQKILDIMEKITCKIVIKRSNQSIFDIPDKAIGVGLVDTARGSLGHWMEIENKVIKHYDIITPSVWNLSPKDNKGVHGAVERALIGTEIKDTTQPVEIGRIVRSFDPCISCATHMINGNREPIDIRLI